MPRALAPCAATDQRPPWVDVPGQPSRRDPTGGPLPPHLPEAPCPDPRAEAAPAAAPARDAGRATVREERGAARAQLRRKTADLPAGGIARSCR